jgi:hypothetical protein
MKYKHVGNKAKETWKVRTMHKMNGEHFYESMKVNENENNSRTRTIFRTQKGPCFSKNNC